MPSNPRSASFTPTRPAIAALLFLSAGVCITSARPVPPLVSDHFTGNSRGVPAGWTAAGESSPSATIIETGTVVTITDVRGGNGPRLLQSSSFGGIDDFSMTVDIGSMLSVSGSDPQAIAGIGGASGYSFLTSFSSQTQAFRVIVLGPSSGELYLPGSLGTYAGGALSYSITGDSDSFRITSPAYSYDSGDILFTDLLVKGFDSPNDFGSLVGVVLGTESGGSVETGTPSSIAFDRIQVTGTLTSAQPVPEPSTYAAGVAVLGAVGATWWRNRKRKSSDSRQAPSGQVL